MNDASPDILAEVLEGLGDEPPRLPAKLFYDALGSKLFEAITLTPEYYPTRCELEILAARAETIAAALGPDVWLIEPGAGVSEKVPLLLERMTDVRGYVPVDIDGDTLSRAARRLRRAFPGLDVHPVVADFTRPFELPALPGGRRVVFYPGSTIGNLVPDEALGFLRGLTRWLHDGDGLLVGFDLEKDGAVLERAYDDAAGVTAAFNRNMLAHVRRRTGADVDPRAFDHVAFWNPEEHRVEMHLRSNRDQAIEVGDARFPFPAGRTIHTENSYKYSRERFVALAAGAGFSEEAFWTDDRGWFGVALFRWASGA